MSKATVEGAKVTAARNLKSCRFLYSLGKGLACLGASNNLNLAACHLC